MLNPSSSPLYTVSSPIARAEVAGVDPVEMVLRFATGTATPSDLKMFGRACRNWIDSNGGLALERCLHLPNTPEKFRLMQRDQWLCEALKLIPEKSLQAACNRLDHEWSEFLARGLWRACRDDPEPPESASPLSRCLFFASRFNRGQNLEAKQIKRVAGHVFTFQCP